MSKIFNDDQKLALTTLDKNVLLSAGAGSGKTEVLSSRFIQILEKGINASNVLAITFTNKAASEMRVRIARNIQEVIICKGKVIDEKGWTILDSKHDTDYWNQQLVDLQNAQISTIHSLCARILLENPVEAKLAPGTGVMEEDESFNFDDECIRGFIRDSIANKKQYVLELIKCYKIYAFKNQLTDMIAYANRIVNFGGDRNKALAAIIKKYDIVPVDKIEAVKVAAQYYIGCVGSNAFKTDKGNNFSKQIIEKILAVKNGLENCLENFKNNKLSCPELEQALADFEGSKGYIKTSGKLLTDTLNNIKNNYKYIKAYTERDSAKELIPLWYKTIEDFILYREAKRNENSMLSFNDLEDQTIALLESNSAIRRKYQEKFKFIMVDEFQDTNNKQKNLIYLLYGNKIDTLDKPLDIPEKNLFVVGDPKQSIYRFRNADIRVFHRVALDIKGGDINNPGIEVKMNTNYRSTRNIIEGCNYFFTKLMGIDASKDVYYEPLIAGLNIEGEPVEYLTVAMPEEGTGSGQNGAVVSADKRNAEAAVLAQRILSLRNEGKPYSDMTILLRSMTHVDKIVTALQNYGIPSVVNGGKGFYKRPEVQDLIMIIKACVSKYNVLELALALKSPFFTEDERYIDENIITELALKGNLWDSLQAYDGEDKLVQAAKEKLKHISDKLQLVGLAELWQFLWNKLDVEKTLISMSNPEFRLANAKKLFAEAIAFANGTNGNITEYLSYIDRIIADDRFKDKCADVIAENAVTIMTIHGSKGLQFPITFVPMLDYVGSGDQSNVSMTDNCGLGIKVPNDKFSTDKTIVYLYNADEDVSLDDEERTRLLYVAMTRAKKQLILSGIECAKVEENQKDFLSLTWMEQLNNSELDKLEKTFEKNASETFVEEVKEKVANWTKGIFDKNTHETEKGKEIEIASSEEQEQQNEKLIKKLDSYGETGVINFTPSALQCYERCPKQYYYLYVIGMPGLNEAAEEPNIDEEGNLVEKERPLHEYRGELEAPLFGNLLHRALELYANTGAQLELANKCFNESMADNCISEDIDFGQAKQMFLNYITSSMYKPIEEAAKNGRCLNELRFNFHINDKFQLSGIMDCVYYDEKGKLHIVDFKTGHYHDKNDGYGMQLALYSLVASSLYGAEVEDAVLHYLPELKTWKLEDADYYQKKAEDIAEKVCSASKTGTSFTCNMASCHNCQYNWLCDKK